ncbi:FtsQ-type POTRA domain-containing protein [Brachybacterium sp. MASK1Z-5]|uniref:FtsQ-type POTRA domain-containing protein n=1 Tax=Brachybacterium halotolerans TaxID=2795215 RepID=A0ABS1B779_9MICO|nr:FtsQ-type POTRA domain-containing protein [Brachybacterium halotolerans]MBK0330513.1 FtsQ-type POTRA domain-containing protein [Brachybacterium halotolerans]
MARRPTPPRSRPGVPEARPSADERPAAPRRQAPAERETPAQRQTSAQRAAPAQRQAPASRKSAAQRQGTAAQKRPAQRPGSAEQKSSAQRTAASGSASTPAAQGRTGADASHEETTGRGRVVQAADRFGGMLRARPWRRRRRAIILGTAGTLLALIVLLVVAITIPPLRVHEVTVSGAGYVDASAITDAAAPQEDHSMLLVRSGAVEKEVEKVPGVKTAQVSKKWPSTLSVEVTERTPLATLKDSDGSTHILDADGVELPEAAGKDKELVPLTIGGKGGDTDAISGSMLSVLAALPDSMRSTVTGITASSTNDVTLTVKSDSGTKTIVWGNAQDSELKAKVATTLLTQPGTEIDVTSPVAPVTR